MSAPVFILAAAAAYIALRLWLKARRRRDGGRLARDRRGRGCASILGRSETGLVALREVRASESTAGCSAPGRC